MASPGAEQTNIVVNKARHLIFFSESELAYNYKTQQWTRIPAYDTYGMFSVNAKNAVIGLVVFSTGSVELQEQLTSTGVAQTAILATAAPNINPGGRAVINGVRPVTNGGTLSVRAGIQDDPADAVSYSGATTPNTRSGMANFRAEGRYIRAELTITGGFTTAMGADIEFSPQGRV